MIKAGSSETGEFSLIGYDDDAKIAGLLYNNSYYRIDDEEFIKYLSKICAKSFIDIAPREETFVITKIDGEFAWADSYGKKAIQMLYIISKFQSKTSSLIQNQK